MSECQRCGEPSVLESRNQKFCKDCFIKFIRGKQRKMMQTLNNNNNTVIDILLPINYDLSNTSYINFSNSITLLDILINYAKDLYKSHFKITILFLVDNSSNETIANARAFFKNVKNYYEYNNIDMKILDLMSFIRENQLLYNINVDKNTAFVAPASGQFTSFNQYINTISNTSTREDLLFNMYWNLIKIFAYLRNFSVVLYANSANNVATKILSNIVKGKGIEIFQILDEEQQLIVEDRKVVTLKALYPLKDVFNKEVVHYIDLLNLTSFLPADAQEAYEKINHQDTGLNNKIVNVKTATLNQLVNDYFNDLEKNGYSTIVSTVVSTGSRLTLPKGELVECPVCKFKTLSNATEWLSNITVNSSCDDAARGDEETIKQSAQLQSNGRLPVNACYGCILSFATSGPDFVWPLNETISQSDKAVLDEYIIDSEDEDEDKDEDEDEQ